ncbi:MAG: hypothetical protein ACOC38_01645 [Promethearchaeia archaeon]
MAEENDDDFIAEEFEWALKDPTEEKLRGLGEVVNAITKKLVDAIGELQVTIDGMEKRIGNLESKVNSMDSRISSGGVASPSSGDDAEAPASSAPPAGAPAEAEPATASAESEPSPGPSGGGRGGLMGELKGLLAARRKKIDQGE